MSTWIAIDEQREQTCEVGVDGAIDPSVLGWERKPEGLCRDEVCVPVPDGLVLDASTLSRLLQRPLAIDHDERVMAFAASPASRSDMAVGTIAPDFALPDLAGTVHRLSDHRGKKVVLYAYASW
jgi:AhpC/TSA family